MQNIAIIHWYGRMKDNEFSRIYADKLVQYIEQGRFDIIISSWWFTDADVHESEAQSIKNTIQPRLTQKQYKWILEENSLTTYENVSQCAKILDQSLQKTITVFCWNTHLPKIAYLSLQKYCWYTKEVALTLMQKDIQKNIISYKWDCIYKLDCNVSFVWFDLGADVEKYGKALWSSIIETHYDEYPNLHNDFVEFRKKDWHLI